jgi:hypothetical protein
VVIIATTRYPNELIRLGKMVRRLGHTLLVIADSALCPYLVLELASRKGDPLKEHQEKLEQAYRENDILFNLHREEIVSP